MPRGRVVQALVRRDLLVSSSYRFAFLLDLFFGFTNLLIYYFISRTFEDISTEDLQGAPSYFAFAAVGVALSLVIQGAAARVVQRLREEQLTGALETLIAQPVTAAELALGLAGFHFAFAVVRAIAYLVIAGLALDADLTDADWLGFAVMMVTTGLAMAAIGVALGAAVVVLKRAELLSAVLLLALSLLGGAYFPTDVLPGWVQPVADVLPTTFAFSGVRNALYTGEDWGLPALQLMAFTLVALPIALLIFRLGLDHARRRGSLSTP